MIYEIKVGKKTVTVQANSLASAEAWIEKVHGSKGKVVEAPTYPEVEVTATPLEEVEVVEELDDEDTDEWYDDEADSNNS
jgi:hypothetical protein